MVILGINYFPQFIHDPAVVLIRDGKIEAMLEEERFVQEKRAFNRVPLNSIKYCLDKFDIKIEEIDYVALSWDCNRVYEKRGLNCRVSDEKMLKMLFPRSIFKYESLPKLVYVDHHKAHAASSFYVSNFDESTIVVVDGQGEESSISIWRGKGNKIDLIRMLDTDGHLSLGYLYDSASLYLGLGVWNSGKFMGLSSYGNPRFDLECININKEYFSIPALQGKVEIGLNNQLDESSQIRKFWIEEFSKIVNVENKRMYFYDYERGKLSHRLEFNDIAKDFAASIQSKLEEVLVNVVKSAINETGCRNVCLSGGVALNCVANNVIDKLDVVDNLFVQPAAGDAGSSLGAALTVLAEVYSLRPSGKFSPYGGPEYSNNIIKNILDNTGVKYSYTDDICGKSSDLLSDGQVIGWFQGKMEFGPRALGSRSILANPCIKNINNIVNDKVKFRELWRPFAPSILNSEKDKYFKDASESPYMLKTASFKEEYRNKFPGITHIDYTARLQTVDDSLNPKYNKLIESFNAKTDVPMVLNTSFNKRGKPIVNSPYEALEMFYSTGMDTLVLGDFIIKK